MTQPKTSLARKLAHLVGPWRWTLLVVGLCIVASAVVELVPPFLVRHVVNTNLVPHRTEGLVLAGVIYLLAVAADAAFTYAYSYLAARVSQQAIAALRVRLFAHEMALPVAYFDRTPIGDVISRSTADVETVDDLFTDGIATLIGQLVPLVAVVGAMLVLSPMLTAVAAIVMPPLLVIVRFLQVRVRDAERQTRVAVGRLNVELAEVVGGVETLRAFGREETFVARFRRALRRTLIAQAQSVKFNAFFAPISGIFASIVIAALIWVGAGDTLTSVGVSLGTLTAFVLLFQNFFAPIVALGDQWQSVQAAIAGAERVFEILDLPTDTPPTPGATPAPGNGIELAHVSFAYTTGRDVVRDVSFSVQPGEHVALVGRTGAGKSTIVSLLGGLYAPTHEAIHVNGRNPRALGDDERRATLGVAPQSLQLFGATMRDNLTLFDPATGEEAIDRAVALAGIRRLVEQLPDGLETPLAGEGRGGGAVLSAGERQLVGLARTLVADPPIVLLDEATAAIDGASDATFRAALRTTARRRGCAIVTVAHRIATAREADRVIVLDDGRIVEQGPPDELIATGGRFAALAELEAAGWDWQDDPPTQDERR
jgi:ABC-type multidrug transport system fused ATPase/permease subunit